MIKIVGAFLLLGACFGPVYGQAKKPAASGTVEAIKQLEHDWSDAQKAGDVDKLGAFLADDWLSVGADGKTSTKKQYLNSIKSGESRLESFEFGPIDVELIGTTVAVSQGSDTEKSTTKGKDTSGKWVWMDVFVERDGKWQAVRSQSAMLK